MRKSLFLLIILCITSVSSAQSNYRGFINSGYSFGVGEYGFDQWNINTVHGVEFLHNSLFIGGGVGFGVSTENHRLKTYSIPVFADVRYTVGNLKVKPYIDMKAGYSELIDEEHDGGGYNSGGFYFSSSIGVSLPVVRKTSVHIGLGYTYNRAIYEFSYIPGDGKTGSENKTFNAGGITLSVGVSF